MAPEFHVMSAKTDQGVKAELDKRAAEAGERLLERALEERRKHELEPPRSPYFNTCVAIA